MLEKYPEIGIRSYLRDNYLAREIQFKEITNLRTSVLGFFFTLKS